MDEASKELRAALAKCEAFITSRFGDGSGKFIDGEAQLTVQVARSALVKHSR